ncbi:MAG: protein kinase [Polyangiaceae bacterium]|nr:protein kinase [Polyangiaceae bacterium]
MAKQDGGGGGQELDFSTWVPSERIPGTRYVVIELVDEGGHGRLYRVQHEITGRVCAFKAILRKFKSFGDLAARLKQEARINTSLSGHPNIAEVLDAGVTEDDRTYCVMQWLDGANLRNVLKNGTGLDVEWACFVVTSVLSALARAHSVDIVHRDIKPENIFLCDDGLVKLIDFGVAKVLNSKFIQTGRGMMPGTIRYMAPEALDGQAASRLSDIYSLGIVFWEVLAGEHPFPQPNQQAAAQAIVHHGVAPLDRSPIAVARSTPALRQVVMRACALDPAERFPSAEAFAEAIALAMGYTPSARPLAAGVYPPSHLGEVPTPAPRPRPGQAPAPVTAPEHSPGSALEMWSPTPRVALTDQAALSLISGSGRSGSEFGVLSHLPPFLYQLPDSGAEERTPSSTPPLVSGTSPKAGARAAANEADTSDEATTLPWRRAAGAGFRWWGPARPLAGRLVTAKRAGVAVAAVAGVAMIAALAFSLGQARRWPPEPGGAATARLDAGGQAPAVTSALLSPSATQAASPLLSPSATQAPSPSAPTNDALGLAPSASGAPSAREAASSPSLAEPAAPSASPKSLPKRAEAQEPKANEPRAGASRRPQPKPAPRGPRLLPKGGLEPGF